MVKEVAVEVVRGTPLVCVAPKTHITMTNDEEYRIRYGMYVIYIYTYINASVSVYQPSVPPQSGAVYRYPSLTGDA